MLAARPSSPQAWDNALQEWNLCGVQWPTRVIAQCMLALNCAASSPDISDALDGSITTQLTDFLNRSREQTSTVQTQSLSVTFAQNPFKQVVATARWHCPTAVYGNINRTRFSALCWLGCSSICNSSSRSTSKEHAAGSNQQLHEKIASDYIQTVEVALHLCYMMTVNVSPGIFPSTLVIRDLANARR